MGIERIDSKLCNGCGICVETCQMDVIRLDEKEKKAIIKYPEDCETTTCGICEIECPKHAIYVALPKRIPPITSWGV